jgi:shikimate dehydrogenase
MRRFGLIGFPLEHSFSKNYFTDKFIREGIQDCTYDNFPIESIQGLVEVLKQHPDLMGLNVTIPYKQEIMRRLNSVARMPEGLYACNCIKIVDGKLLGYNTDVIGFEKSLTPLLKSHHTKALVLGNGGAAVAVIYVLKKLGIAFQVVSRTIHHGSTLTYQDLNAAIIQENLFIINTTPLGMFPHVDASPEIPYEFLTPQHLCYDLIYNPETTQFLRKAASMGATIKNGLEMLELQAEESWRIWNED